MWEILFWMNKIIPMNFGGVTTKLKKIFNMVTRLSCSAMSNTIGNGKIAYSQWEIKCQILLAVMKESGKHTNLSRYGSISPPPPVWSVLSTAEADRRHLWSVLPSTPFLYAIWQNILIYVHELMYETLMNACRLYISETIHQYYRNTFILVLQEIRQNSQNVENFPLVFLIPLLQFNNIALQKHTHFF